jgi:hypothetical protein
VCLIGVSEEKEWSLGNIWRDNGWEFPGIDEITQFTNSRNQSRDSYWKQESRKYDWFLLPGRISRKQAVRPGISSCGALLSWQGLDALEGAGGFLYRTVLGFGLCLLLNMRGVWPYWKDGVGREPVPSKRLKEGEAWSIFRGHRH